MQIKITRRGFTLKPLETLLEKGKIPVKRKLWGVLFLLRGKSIYIIPCKIQNGEGITQSSLGQRRECATLWSLNALRLYRCPGNLFWVKAWVGVILETARQNWAVEASTQSLARCFHNQSALLVHWSKILWHK